MNPFWNSINGLSSCYSKIQLTIILFGFLTLVSSIAAYILSQRINYLQNETRKTMQFKIDEIDIKQKPRTLSQEQKKIILDSLKGFKNTKITITTNLGDSECVIYAQEFVALFKSLNWQVTGLEHAIFTDPVFGLYLAIKDPSNPPACANILAETLTKAGIQIQWSIRPYILSDSIEIVVGSRR